MTKFASLFKIHTKIIAVKRNLELNDLVFSIIHQKHALISPGLYRLIFQSLYHTSLVLPKGEIDEIIDFRNFRKLLINKSAPSFRYFGTPFPKWEKRNEVTGHMNHAAMYGSHLYIALGKLILLQEDRDNQNE